MLTREIPCDGCEIGLPLAELAPDRTVRAYFTLPQDADRGGELVNYCPACARLANIGWNGYAKGVTPFPDPFTAAYLACAAWLATDGEEATPIDQLDPAPTWHPSALAQAARECVKFQEDNAGALADLDSSQAGHDFYLTRNGHGAGFWDRGHPEEIGEALTKASETAGARDVEVGDPEEDGARFLYFFPSEAAI